MIRNNDATELCITKGQEGRVVGWQEAVGSRNQTILDTFFVELVAPPKTIQIKGLPPNVVALPRTAKKIWCTLPDDRSIQITREQVLVLPNFAMTDYSSQGKTRPINVVDLNNCKDHFSYYTALSRSATSEGTVILQGMDPYKITKGIHGSLRQEFRELELLNEITELRYEQQLPHHVNGVNRRELMHTYRTWRGAEFSMDGLHPALASKQGEDDRFLHAAPMGQWQMLEKERPSKKEIGNELLGFETVIVTKTVKRKNTLAVKSNAPKRRKVAVPAPIGLKWDCVDYSCAYDPLFTGLYHIWQGHGPLWSERLASVTGYTAQLAKGWESFAEGTRALETVRDQVRASLAHDNPAGFPAGPVFTYLYMLTDAVFGTSVWGRDTIKCVACNLIASERAGYPCTRTVYKHAGLSSRYKQDYMLSHWLNDLKISRAIGRCRICKSGLARIEVPDVAPPVLYFAVDDPMIKFDPALNISVGGMGVRYVLRSVIYVGNHHFTSRIIKENGDVWYHDGIETKSTSIAEGNIHSLDPAFLNTCVRHGDVQDACGVLYAIVDL
jgi:hypothetical protein